MPNSSVAEEVLKTCLNTKLIIGPNFLQLVFITEGIIDHFQIEDLACVQTEVNCLNTRICSSVYV